MKFEIMHSLISKYSMRKMAAFLGVTRPGYYKWMKRRDRPCKDAKLLVQIREVYEQSDRAYGSPRILRALKAANVRCGKAKVEKLMKHNEIRAISVKKFNVQTTNSQHEFPISENLLQQNFTTNAPNKVWVSDITYIRARNSWLYLCVVMDLYSRKIVGWKIDRHMLTHLVTETLRSAVAARCPEPGLIFHSDRGSQYASNEFRSALLANGMISSMSRTANCYDNSCAESVFATIKKERLHHILIEDLSHGKKELFKYIELFYNRKRLHSTLQYLSPEEFEAKNVA